MPRLHQPKKKEGYKILLQLVITEKHTPWCEVLHREVSLPFWPFIGLRLTDYHVEIDKVNYCNRTGEFLCICFEDRHFKSREQFNETVKFFVDNGWKVS
jgi:hypothetical protein